MEACTLDGKHVAVSTIPGYSCGCPFIFDNSDIYICIIRGLARIAGKAPEAAEPKKTSSADGAEK